MSVVLFAPQESSESVALRAALEAGLGSIRHVTGAGRALAALAERPRSILVLDLRGGGAHELGEAEQLARLATPRRTAALVDEVPLAPAECDAVFARPFFLEDVVRWCARATVAPLTDGILADLAAGLSHEIGNPLTSLFLQIELLRADDEAGTARQHLSLIEDAARRIQTVVQDVATAAHNHPVQSTSIELAELLEVATERLANQGADVSGRLDIRCGEELLVRVDAELLGRALADVWEYLLRAGRPTDRLAVDGRRGPGGSVRIDQRAPTPRLPPDAAGRLFTPLWARQALGLPGGLSLTSARSAFVRHRGNLRARQGRDGMLVVEALLPEEAQTTFEFAES